MATQVGPDRGRPSPEDGGTLAGHDALAVRLKDLARTLQQPEDLARTLQGIVLAAVQLIPGVDEASVSVVVGRRRVSSQAPSGPLAAAVDALQDELGQGPCLDAAYEHETVRVADLSTEPRWPLFTARALEAGAAGMLCFQLYVAGDDLGALNLYARVPDAFDDESEHVGLLFAAHAAIAFDAVREQAGLSRSVLTRQLIGQAQGILIERHKVTPDQAFVLLVQASQRSNTKLRDLAEALVATGAFPDR